MGKANLGNGRVCDARNSTAVWKMASKENKCGNRSTTSTRFLPHEQVTSRAADDPTHLVINQSFVHLFNQLKKTSATADTSKSPTDISIMKNNTG